MDAAFCFYCYLFGQDVGKQGGGETFVTKGFKLWNQVAKLDSHVGGVNSAHNQAVKKGEDLLKEKQHIQSVFVKQSKQDKTEYRIQLNAIVDCVKFLLCWGLAFRGHDESQGSSDRGNFLELLQFLGITMNISMKCCKNLVKIASLPTPIFKKTLWMQLHVKHPKSSSRILTMGSFQY